MSTLDQVVTKTKNKLSGAIGREKINTLNGSLTSNTTTVVLTYTPGAHIVAGVIIEIDYEQMMVVSVSTNTLTVIRGWNGTSATTHADLAVVYSEPRFPRQSILDEVIAELRAIPQTIYQVVNTVITFASGVNQTDLSGATGTVYRILAAERASFEGSTYPSFKSQLRLIRNADTSVYTSGYAVSIEGGNVHGQTATVRVTYAKELDTTSLSYSTNLQSTVGLAVSAEDILSFGAASRLLYDKEALRLDFGRQGQSRAAEEIPVEANTRQALRWRAEADRRISEEATRLTGLWGIMGA